MACWCAYFFLQPENLWTLYNRQHMYHCTRHSCKDCRNNPFSTLTLFSHRCCVSFVIIGTMIRSMTEFRMNNFGVPVCKSENRLYETRWVADSGFPTKREMYCVVSVLKLPRCAPRVRSVHSKIPRCRSPSRCFGRCENSHWHASRLVLVRNTVDLYCGRANLYQ